MTIEEILARIDNTLTERRKAAREDRRDTGETKRD